MYDALVIRYDAAKGGTRQPMHRDAALLSVNIALSSPDEYEGGGTLFQTVGGGPVRLGRGHAMVHASGVRHAGDASQTFDPADRRHVLDRALALFPHLQVRKKANSLASDSSL